MATEQFSLCWDNFHTNMSSGLSSLLKSEDLVDVTLAAEGRYLKAHKMILSVCSPYFKELFQVNPCKHPIVFLKDVSYSVLNNLLQFMYQGEVKVSQDDLGTFIKTAEGLKIKGLTGDSNNPIETDTEATIIPVQNNMKSTESSSSPTTFTRKTVREKSPPARKKMLGPASKRFRSDSEYVHSQQPEPQPTETQETELTLANDLEVKNLPPLAPLTTFKLEPEETAVSLANEEDLTYDESAMDELGMDNTADYMIDSTDEVKAGTSTEVANAEVPGENQGKGLYKFVVTQQGTLNLVLHHHLYRPRNLIHGTEKRLWICTWRNPHCPARAISCQGKLIAKRGMHNHPSLRDAIANKEAAGLVCYRNMF